MREKVHPLRINLKLTASTTTHDVSTDKVKTGEQWKIDQIIVRNNTRANSDVEVYINTGAYYHAVDFVRGIAESEWAKLDIDLTLKEGESLRFYWTDVADGDVLDMHITGDRRYRKD